MTTASVTVIVVNWNAGDLLAQCLRCLQAQTVQPERVIVIDNASTDGSANIVQQWPTPWPALGLQRMERNLGFAAGNNHAIAQCATTWVALLNPDAFAAPDWLEQLLAAAQAHPETAAFGARQLCDQPPHILDGTGDCYHPSGLAWRRAHRQPDGPHHQVAGEIFSPCAAAALYRTAVLQQLGGFDERYFCYLEDVDLGFRLRLAGHHARYAPAAQVRHVGSATTGGQRSSFAVYHGQRNMVWTFVKNMPSPLFWALLPLHVAANLALLALWALRGHGGAVLRAKKHALQGLPAAWRQRRQVQSTRRASLVAIWRAMSFSLRRR